MYTDPWTEAELDLLREHYEEKGCKWDGWKELLPNRSPMSIRRKSNMIGLKIRSKLPRAKRTVYATGANECEHTYVRTPDPYEERVMGMMHDGMAPSQIDRAMRWRPGRAAMIVIERWERDNER